jgi:hypothetical protein
MRVVDQRLGLPTTLGGEPPPSSVWDPNLEGPQSCGPQPVSVLPDSLRNVAAHGLTLCYM